ncbi:MAG: hypothetical protein DMG12_11275 [Acidobacteria bacterium]|nr:MAG: hypothetical protein DMG12_11275 [Acidobacteriota bacterium]
MNSVVATAGAIPSGHDRQHCFSESTRGSEGLDCDNDSIVVKERQMKLHKRILLLSSLTLASVMPAWSQVEKAELRTTAISCGVCAAVSEVKLRRIAGVDKVTISKSAESVTVSYKPGAVFQPLEIRKILEPLNVGIAQFQISATGRIQEQGGKQFFVAGKDKFVLRAAANAPKIPTNTAVSIEAILNDKIYPMELRVMTFKPVAQ